MVDGDFVLTLASGNYTSLTRAVLTLNSVTSAKTYAVENNDAYSDVNVSAVTGETVTTLLFNVGPYGAFKEAQCKGRISAYN